MIKDLIWLKQNLLTGAGVLAGVYAALRLIARIHMEPEGINDDNPYLEKPVKNEEACGYSTGIYIGIVKPSIDRILSFAGLVVLSPFCCLIAAAIVLDDPGPVLFRQKRVGVNKAFFYCHKFRSMKVSTPHNVPTHELKEPEAYITKVGSFLRRTSLDELPQIWDIFRGKMSVVGPRPALWNQNDLIAARSRVLVSCGTTGHSSTANTDGCSSVEERAVDANAVMPGLTGLAQISGRDELGILEKAKLDGEYVKQLRQGGLDAFFFDVRMFLGTVKNVIRQEGIVEGGTGKYPGSPK